MPPAADASQRRLALIVATSDCRDPTLHGLRASGTNAEALAMVLGDPEIGRGSDDEPEGPICVVGHRHTEPCIRAEHSRLPQSEGERAVASGSSFV